LNKPNTWNTSLSTHLKRWSGQLATTSDSARLDAEILLKHASGLSNTQLIVRDTEPLDDQTVKRVDTLIEARRKGSPIAYLTGQREFYALNLKINQHVLIPRPETELLVDTALKIIHSNQVLQILDLGTGSGAIALAIAANAPKVQILATDIDKSAIGLANQNARIQNVPNVQFLSGDWFIPLEGKQFDLIVSNPPYIDPDDPHLNQGDVRFEPTLALVAADHGLADIRNIVALAPTHLEPGGSIALEHGYDQAQAVRNILEANGFTDIEALKDLNQLDRVSLGTLST
jgi:release factor glutamine methyltransferase